MGVVLVVYGDDAFREYLLPAEKNIDNSIIIAASDFGLKNDVELKLESVEARWKFVDNQEQYQLYKNEKSYLDQYIQQGDQLILFTPESEQLSLVVIKTENSFRVYDKYLLNSKQEISIGKNKENTIIFDSLDLVSRYHAVIRFEGKWKIEDMSSNGTFINGKRIQNCVNLKFGDVINVFGLQIVFLETHIGICFSFGKGLIDKDILTHVLGSNLEEKNAKKSTKREIKEFFHRAPRYLPKIKTEAIEIESPPALSKQKKQPIMMTIGPSMTMMLPMLLGSSLAIYSSSKGGGTSSAFMYTGLITAGGSALLGTFWAITNLRFAKKSAKEDQNHRFEAYGEYLIKITDEIRETYEYNREQLINTYMPSTKFIEVEKSLNLLWNRNVYHEDFLTHRIGVGTIPFQVDIQIPKEKFTLINDTLANKPAMIKEEFKDLYDVPVCIDAKKHSIIGVVGGKGKIGALQILRNLTMQIAFSNCYTDVKLIYIYDERKYAKDEWEYTKWLPHTWSEDKKTRYVARNKQEASDVFYELTEIFRNRLEEKSPSDKINDKPYYILVVENQEWLEGEMIAKYVYEKGSSEYGLTTILIGNRYDDLPNECEYIVENTDEFKGVYNVLDPENQRIEVAFDDVSKSSIEEFARDLLQYEVKEVTGNGEIPGSLDFFSMHGVSTLNDFGVIERWRKNRNYENMRALIGHKAGGTPCYLDIHEKYHGPHGLVAGTTGSGKSETLQTYILSLSINFSPDDIAFFIIDYKGGGMANLFSGLPHMIGSISNLSGNQVRRAMVSIKSENVRRQKVFNEHEVNNINLYTKLYKNGEASVPIPHLFIIIDEFAELKREEPEFMRELVSVAQVGRSLGVHLILSTQKPNGTVDENIWSNSKFKLCLRVQDKQDSNDMLHKPDAAFLKEAGRCYFQVGNDEIYELFQSGWSGATYDENGASNEILAQMITIDGKAAIVGSRQKKKKMEKSKLEWISFLLNLVREISKDYDESLGDIIAQPTALKKFISHIFKALNQIEIDYQDSMYNRRRIEELLRIYFLQLEEHPDHSLSWYAENIIKYANVTASKLPEKKEKTQLDAVIEYLDYMANKNGFNNKQQLWMPLLPSDLILSRVADYVKNTSNEKRWARQTKQWTLDAIVGMCDDPVNQAQFPLTVDFAQGGHHAICGSVFTGKSIFLQTIMFSFIHKYSPEEINLYALDFSSRSLSAFENSVHVGGVMYENDSEKIGKFFNMMNQIIEDRKKKFQGGNYSQFIRANGVIEPAIVIVIDNFAGFKEKTADQYNDNLINISRNGIAYGIYLLISAAGYSATDIQSKIGDNIKTTLCLEMADKYQYSEALKTTQLDVMHEKGIKGRGLCNYDGRILEYQVALSESAEDDYERIEKIKVEVEALNNSWDGRIAESVPCIPENPKWNEFQELKKVKRLNKSENNLAIGYDLSSANIFAIDTRKIFTYLIQGRVRTGKKNLLKCILFAANQKENVEICLFDNKDQSFKIFAEKINCKYIIEDQDYFDYFNDLLPVFKERNLMKRQHIQDGLNDEEIYEKMSKEKAYYICIADLNEFIMRVRDKEKIGAIEGFLKNIAEKGRLHNVFFFMCLDTKNSSQLAGIELFDHLVSLQNGIHLGGNVNNQQLLNFDYVNYREKEKTLKPGIAMIPQVAGEYDVEKVVIPLV
jgi:S-DNA-T family DNA segregation ATPase FtsK/SpoIIIE